MEPVYFTVGPTQLAPRLRTHLDEAFARGIPSISHRSGAFRGIFAHARERVRRVLGAPEGIHVFFLGSATEAMERVAQNCAARSSFHLVQGAFGERFFKTALECGKSALKTEAPAGEGFDLSAVAVPEGAELIALTHNETSTGVALDPASFRLLRKRHPKAIIAVDIVSSTPYAALDYGAVDAAFFSVQKGFGMPAGLGVLLVNDRCIEKSRAVLEGGISIGSFHNFPTLLSYAAKEQTPETPNVLAIYLLGKVCDDYLERGMERIRAETEEKALLLYGLLEEHPRLRPAAGSGCRSRTVIVAETPRGSAPIIERMKARGFILASGYGAAKERQIRIGNFPQHSAADMKRLAAALAEEA